MQRVAYAIVAFREISELDVIIRRSRMNAIGHTFTQSVPRLLGRFHRTLHAGLPR